MANFRGFHGMIKCTLTACVLCVLSGISAYGVAGKYYSESGDPTFSGYFDCGFGAYNENGDAVICTACSAGSALLDEPDFGATTSGDCYADGGCINDAHVASWRTPQWTSRGNGTANMCQILTCNSGYNLKPNPLSSLPVETDGNSSDVPWNDTWSVHFDGYGTVHGEVLLSTTGGDYATIGDPDTNTSAGSLWCRAVGFTPDGETDMQTVIEPRWIYAVTFGVEEDADMLYNADAYCADLVQYNPEFRAAIFGQGRDLWNLAESVVPNNVNYDSNGPVTVRGFTNVQTWDADFNYGTVNGIAMCSNLSGDNHNGGYGGNPTDWTAIETDLVGAAGGEYCWCKASEINETGGHRYVASSPWVYGGYIYSGFEGGNCNIECSKMCTDNLQGLDDAGNQIANDPTGLYFRKALFSGVQYGWLNSCVPNMVNLEWFSNGVNVTNTINNASSCEYGVTLGMTPINPPANRTGYTFNGWRVSGWTAPSQQ